MAELPVEKMLISEVLQKVSNAKTKKEKVLALQKYKTPALQSILIWNFDDSAVSVVPEGDVPFTPNNTPEGTKHTLLLHEWKKLYNFIKGGNNGLQQGRREMMFIQMLEGLHETEANVVCLAKDSLIGKRYKITKACVSEAYPEIEWGNRS
tara:strand:+ start:2846 stop:3298 length:453 start_codon:yes stop_codon:yes gene_type:complete